MGLRYVGDERRYNPNQKSREQVAIQRLIELGAVKVPNAHRETAWVHGVDFLSYECFTALYRLHEKLDATHLATAN